MEQMKYEDSNIDERILRAVKEMGFEQMTPIQQQAIPYLLDGRDIIGQAQTGTGKTAAFGIPMVQMADPKNRSVQAVVLCPTRELAIQAAKEIRGYAKFIPGIKVLPVYGGQDITRQIRSLREDVQIVVGTPGRVMDHMRRHTLKFGDVKLVVLDEADEMLNMGFREDMETILSQMPQERQTALFSATMPKPILEIAGEYQKPDAVEVKVAAKELTIPLVKQYYYEVRNRNREEAASRLIDYYNPKRTLIFCNTKRTVDTLTEALKGRGYFAEGLHGDLTQNQRDTVMNHFRSDSTDILIATDVAARGIDVEDVEAVINYDLPQDVEYYVHRIGRTGRAGRKGRAFTFVFGKEIYKVREIERTCRTKMQLRMVPSIREITGIKAEKALESAEEAMKSKDISAALKLVEQKLNEEEYTALELAAAFLSMQMEAQTENTEDIVDTWSKDDRKQNSRGRSYEGRGRSERSYEGRSRSGKREMRRDGSYGNYRGKDSRRGFTGVSDKKQSGSVKSRKTGEDRRAI